MMFFSSGKNVIVSFHPFWEARAVASRFLNELRAPLPPLFFGHQTWIKSLWYSRCGFSGFGDFLQLQSPIILTAWALGVRALRATPPDGCEAACLLKCIPALPPGQGKDTSHWPLHWGHPLTAQLPNLKSRFTSRERWEKVVNRLATEQLRVGVCFNSPDHLK